MTGGVPVVSCGNCDGKGATLAPCGCTTYPNRLLVEDLGHGG